MSGARHCLVRLDQVKTAPTRLLGLRPHSLRHLPVPKSSPSLSVPSSLLHDLVAASVGNDFTGVDQAGLASVGQRGTSSAAMATASGASSIGSRVRRVSGQASADGQPLCPICHTTTVVERMSRTEKHLDMPFYTCKNQDWGSSKCNFFMWKPVSDDDGRVDVPTLLAAFQALENSVQVLSNNVHVLSVDVKSIAGQQSLNRWLNVASLFVGVVIFVVLCMKMQYKA